MIQESSSALGVQDHMEARFKNPELHGCGKFHGLEGPVHGVRDPKEDWSRDLLFKFPEAKKTFPIVLCVLVWRILPPSPGVSLLSTDKSCRRIR